MIELLVIPAMIIFAVVISLWRKNWMATPVFAIANIVIFIYMVILENAASDVSSAYQSSAYYDVLMNSAFTPANLGQVSALPSLMTSMFLHVGFMHLLGNLIFLIFLGLALEERIGTRNFIIIYFVTGLGGTLAHWFSDPNSIVPALGASGAIFGIGGALLILYPREKMLLPIPLLVIVIFRRVEVWIAVMAMAVIESGLILYNPSDNVSHWAHMGGLAAGMLIAPMLVERGARHPSGRPGHSSSVHREKLDFAALRQLATTDAERRLLDQIEEETIDDVRNAWLEQFWQNIKCRRCGQPLTNEGKKTITCYNCGMEYRVYR